MCRKRGGGHMLCLAFGFNIITFISYPFLIFARKKGEGVLGRFLCALSFFLANIKNG
jgi:hypothetical protein